ncbi:MAG: ABC transporter ATP-binding protein [Lautropia sp.]|nr:ABC transporter ATP-binding protein [Lautropia sp.]
MTGAAALACEAVTVRFGALIALDKVSLNFLGVGIHSVIGPNGAGKTTLINVLSGRQRPSEGRVVLDGRDITSMQTFLRARSGIGRSFQITKIFPTLSVFENLRLAAQARAFRLQPFWRRVQGYQALADQAERVAIDIGLQGWKDAPAEQLSHGDQRALELGITLMTEPTILLLDEPLAGVGEHEIDRTMALIERVARGRTVILIEHNIDVVMKVSHRIIVMDQGAVLSIGTPDEVRRDPAVRKAYLGDDHAGA